MLKRLLRRRDRGVSALEFVLVMPVLLLIMVGITDLGNALQQSIRLESAARAGAQVAFTRPADTRTNANDANAALIRNQVLAHLQPWPVATSCTGQTGGAVCVTVRAWCQCPAGNNVDISLGFACDADPPPCEDYAQYTSITATRNYEPLLYVPNRVLRGNVEVRIR